MLPASNMELSFKRPDVIAALSEEQRQKRCVQTWEETYALDNKRFFIRAVIPMNIQNSDENYCLGSWVEVQAEPYKAILALWDNDEQASQPAFDGWLANDIPYSKNSMGCQVKVQLTRPKSVPELTIVDEQCTLYAEQVSGISLHRANEFTHSLHSRQLFSVVEEDEFEPATCSCCESEIRRVCGCIEDEQGEIQCDYWLRIPLGHKGMFTVAVAIANGGTQRVAVLRAKNTEEGLVFWIQTTEESPWTDFGEYGVVMDRDEVLEDIYKALIFNIVDKIADSDSRLKSQIGR